MYEEANDTLCKLVAELRVMGTREGTMSKHVDATIQLIKDAFRFGVLEGVKAFGEATLCSPDAIAQAVGRVEEEIVG